jgi:putative membrane protein
MHRHPVRDFARKFLWAICAAAALVAAIADAGTLSDAQIAGIYIQVNGFDIDTALLGRSQASSEAVRQLAEHVAADHIGVRQAIYEIATNCGASPVLPGERVAAAVEHDKTLARLLALKGAEFDKAYVEHEVAFHRAAIAAVKTVLLPSAKCPELQAHLKSVVPAFEHHLMQTEELAAAPQAAK